MAGNGKRNPSGEGISAAGCLEIRREILTVLSEGGAFSEITTVHLVKCSPCREWVAEVKTMHESCRQSQGACDPSRLTASIIGGCDIDAARRSDFAPGTGRGAGRVLDHGALFVVILFAGLFCAIMASFLEGAARILYPAACAVAMIVPAVWVYADATRRGMPAGFWAALQPFTVPVGIGAYLICRRGTAVRCPSCGAARSSRSAFCSACGGRLTETCCGCGKPVRREFRICPFCGTRLEECSMRDDQAGSPCGWSRPQIVFLAAGNAVLLGALIAVLLRGDERSSFLAATLYLFGLFPIFNWISLDARRRAMDSIAWGLSALVFSYLGLVIYLACRKDERVACPVCGSHPPAHFSFCPCCGSLLRVSCARCGTAAAPGDRYCDACGAGLS